MSKIVAQYEGELRTRVKHIQSGQEIITDAPIDNQGKGEAFSPTDLTVSSLASCILTIMGIAAKRKQLDLIGTKIEATKIMSQNPRRISEIGLEIFFKVDFSDKEKKILERAAHTCPVHRSLNGNMKKKINFIYPP